MREPILIDRLEIERFVARFLPPYLLRQRWFGDKIRKIETVRAIHWDHYELDSEILLALIVVLRFSEGEEALYFVPLLTGSRHYAEGEIGPIESAAGTSYAADAALQPAFQRWIARQIASADGVGAAWRATRHRRLVSQELARIEPALGAAEQSNTSILYPSAAIVKLFRKLQPGIHPEVELSGFLTEDSRFRNTPALLGSWETELDGWGETALAVAHAWVVNDGDGWSWLIATLERALTDHDWSRASAAPAGLGQVTAEMHLALAGTSGNTDLAAEPISAEDAGGWSGALAERIARLPDLLDAGSAADDRNRSLVAAVKQALPQIARRAGGFERLVGASKTRVHGDYHLGQTLHTPSGEFYVLDFEGEPLRPLDERRRKSSPLKDVAGMLRSFSYARGTIEQRVGNAQRGRASAMVDWERESRTKFLKAYLDAARANGAPFLPASNEDVRAALAAWELDKVVYEIAYEANNRPEWLWLPLSGVLTER